MTLSREDPENGPEPPTPEFVVAVSGDVDLTTAPQLRDRLLHAVTAGHRDIVVDVTDVTFIDSSGLSVLVTAYKRAHADGGSLSVRGARGLVRSVLAVSGLDQVLLGRGDAGAARVGPGGTAAPGAGSW